MLTTCFLQAKANWTDSGSEVVHIIAAKLNRRLRKFELLKQSSCLQPCWAELIQQRIVGAHTFIDQKWQALVSSKETNIDTTAIPTLRPEDDLDMFLPALNNFLASVNARKHDLASSSFKPTSERPVFSAGQLPSSLTGPEDYKYFRLAAFESWVEQHLHTWLMLHLSNEATCGQLRRLIEHYFDTASAAYKEIPVSMSVMYLTLAELWIACDKSACAVYPLLRGYDTEICLTEFQCLVLPLKMHMERLHVVESYVQSRRAAVVISLPSLYRSFGHPSSFAVKYFDQSGALQATLQEIERDAARKREQKRQELKDLKARHANLMDQFMRATCDSEKYVYNRRFGYTTTRHPAWCRKCSYQTQANALTIRIYEWPLSSVPAVAKATVFELKIPQAFSDWRDASIYLTSTILGHQYAQARKPAFSYTLNGHQYISQMLSPSYWSRRIVPLSNVKPCNVTHWKEKDKIQHLTDADVCLDNALQYAYYDRTLGVLTAAALTCTEDVPKRCMYLMPQRSKSLERFMYRLPQSPDGLLPNEVIVSLARGSSDFYITSALTNFFFV